MIKEHVPMKLPGMKKVWLTLAVSWFIGCVLWLIYSFTTDSFQAKLGVQIYCLAVGILSPAAFCAYGWDKWKAEREGHRISEKKLHLLAFAGGWPGAVAGQQWFRHKTLKPVFRTILVLTVLLHVAVVATLCFR